MRAIGFAVNSENPVGASRTIRFSLTDGDGGTSNNANANVTVFSVNDAPAGTDGSVTVNEDNSYVFTPADFGFSDPAENNPFIAVTVSTLPANGTLLFNGNPVAPDAFILTSDIDAGKLTFQPAPDGNGNGYASFTFQVVDGGGTLNSGQDTDQSPNTLTINVTAVNDAPVNGVPGAQSTNEDTAKVFSAGNGNAISVGDVDAVSLTVTLTVAHGTLTLSGTAGLTFDAGANGSATMTISGTAAAINAALEGLSYLPAGNYNGPDSLQIQTSDNGSSGSGGTLTDSDSVAITVTSVNDAPAGTDKAVTINEDSTYVFATADFGFTDPNDGPANSLQAVTFTTLPANGTLFYDADGAGAGLPFAVSAGQSILASEIALGKVTFVPAPDANGTPLTSFTFQVQDDGGTGGGGQDLDQSANSFTFNVSAVNDAPVNGVPGAQSTNEDASLTLSSANANAIQISDVDAGAGSISVTLSVAHGTLTVAVVGGISFTGSNGTASFTISGTLAAINSALAAGLTYAPTANYHGPDAISVQTTDNGNTGSGPAGTDSDSIAITVNSVNDAPSGTNHTATGSEDDPLVFTAADFGFSDAIDGNSLLAVKITTLPSPGTLFLDSDGPGGGAPVAVLVGQFVSVADINAGHLYFQPAPDGFGTAYASFTFQVQDDGGTANGGVDTDPTPNTMTIDVTSDNLPPVVDLNGAGAGIDYTTSFTEDGAAIGIGSGILVSDPDSGLGDMIESATVTLTDKAAGDALTIAGPLPGGITSSITVNAGTIVVTLSGTASQADYATALGQIRYATTSQDPTAAGSDPARTITVTVNDGLVDSAVATTTVNIVAVDDAPVAAPDAFTITESGLITAGNLFASNGSGADSDPDSPLAISAVNGSGANVGAQITLASGALLKVNANGTFDYDPNGAFLSTPTGGSGASNTPAHDSFTYTLAGGNTVTVSITLTGLDTDDLLLGTAGADMLIAGAGNDYLDGLGGADLMFGGTGNDVYIADLAADRTLEASGEGSRDVVYAKVSYELSGGSEIEVLSAYDQSGSAGLILVGNELDQEIYGNAGSNYLQGGGGNDYLIGLGGNDVYFVTGPGDHIVESAGGGTRDTAYAVSDYKLETGVEIEVLSSSNQAGTGAQTLIGNAFNQEIYGNNGANYLEGGGGADVLIGLGGDDVYVVDSDEFVSESAGGGRDVVYATASYALIAGEEVEVLSTVSQVATTGINLTGNDLANELYGNNGANVLNGGGGADFLQGFGGADTFAFTTALGGGNVDTIADFVSGLDRIALDDAIFDQLVPGALGGTLFHVGAEATDEDQRIIYDDATGNLYYDADGIGAGAQILVATLSGHPPLTAGDFVVI